MAEMLISSEEAIKKYFNTVHKLALSQTGNKTIAEDVVQDTFLRFLQSNKVFESEEHIKAWLIRVTINCAKSVLMSSWFKKTVPLEEEISFSEPERHEVYFAVLEIPPKYRTIIHLFYYEDMSIKEIADALKMNESTVKSRLHRGREMVKMKLRRDYDFV